MCVKWTQISFQQPGFDEKAWILPHTIIISSSELWAPCLFCDSFLLTTTTALITAPSCLDVSGSLEAISMRMVSVTVFWMMKHDRALLWLQDSRRWSCGCYHDRGAVEQQQQKKGGDNVERMPSLVRWGLILLSGATDEPQMDRQLLWVCVFREVGVRGRSGELWRDCVQVKRPLLDERFHSALQDIFPSFHQEHLLFSSRRALKVLCITKLSQSVRLPCFCPSPTSCTGEVIKRPPDLVVGVAAADNPGCGFWLTGLEMSPSCE